MVRHLDKGSWVAAHCKDTTSHDMMSAKCGPITVNDRPVGESKNEGTEEELLAKADDAFVSSCAFSYCEKWAESHTWRALISLGYFER